MVSNFRLQRKPLRNGLLVLLFLTVFVSACGPASTSSSSSTPTVSQEIKGIFHEYALPASPFEPLTITAGADGNLWFTEIAVTGGAGVAGRIERITPTGTLSVFSLPSADTPPTDIITGPDGNLWFTGGNKIARMTPMGKISAFNRSPGALSLAIGPDGNLWFTEQYGKIGRMTLTGEVSEFSLPDQGEPLAITAGADGNLWFTEKIGLGSGGSSIGRITTAGKITKFPLRLANTYPNSITAGPDGNLWFTEEGFYGGPSKIGVITPQGMIREFMLSHSPLIGSITRGPEGGLWFTEFQYGVKNGGTGKIGRITTAGKISEFPLPTYDYSLTSITFGTDHTLWFTEGEGLYPYTKNGKIGHLV